MFLAPQTCGVFLQNIVDPRHNFCYRHTMDGKEDVLELVPISPLKRAFDVVASAIVIVMLSPIMLVLLVLMAVERCLWPATRGPLLYEEVRISQGEPFAFYKIRTFRLSALEKASGNGIVHTKNLEHDFRNLTLTGMMLIQTYLDEFPQLFLVLIGEMSFVGPRPTNLEVYERDIAGGNYSRAILKAGLTGRFQTHKSAKYGLNQRQVDMEYAHLCKTCSGLEIIRHDGRILLETVYTIFRAEGI